MSYTTAATPISVVGVWWHRWHVVNFELRRSSINPLDLFGFNREILHHVKWSNY